MSGNDSSVQRAQVRATRRQMIIRTDRRDGTVEWTYEPGRYDVAAKGTRTPQRSARK